MDVGSPSLSLCSFVLSVFHSPCLPPQLSGNSPPLPAWVNYLPYSRAQKSFSVLVLQARPHISPALHSTVVSTKLVTVLLILILFFFQLKFFAYFLLYLQRFQYFLMFAYLYLQIYIINANKWICWSSYNKIPRSFCFHYYVYLLKSVKNVFLKMRKNTIPKSFLWLVLPFHTRTIIQLYSFKGGFGYLFLRWALTHNQLALHMCWTDFSNRDAFLRGNLHHRHSRQLRLLMCWDIW